MSAPKAPKSTDRSLWQLAPLLLSLIFGSGKTDDLQTNIIAARADVHTDTTKSVADVTETTRILAKKALG